MGREETLELRHLVGARVDGYRLRDGMVNCRGSICSTPRFTLGEVTERELHGAFSAGQLEALGKHEVWRTVVLVGRMMPRLLAVHEHIIKSWDSKSCCVIWQTQNNWIFAARVLDAQCLPIGYLQEAETGHKGVPTTSNISQRQIERIGVCGPPLWLWDSGIQWIGGILHSSVSMVGITCTLIRS